MIPFDFWSSRCLWDTQVIPNRLMNMCVSATSLVVQWVRLCAPNAGGQGFNPWREELDPTCHN